MWIKDTLQNEDMENSTKSTIPTPTASSVSTTFSTTTTLSTPTTITTTTTSSPNSGKFQILKKCIEIYTILFLKD